jgi:hypothetical protein
VPKQIKEARKELEGTLEAVLFSEKMDQIERLPVSALAEKLQQTDNVDTVVFDGVITQRLVDIASDKGVKFLVAARVSDQVKQPLKVHLLTFSEMES